MIGYVLLVAIAIIMSMIVFQFIRTYVPKDIVDCPDGVSVFIQETEYDCDADTLKVTIKNNGRFNIAGYFIHATTSADQELATLDLSENMSSGAETYRNSLLFDTGKNALLPNEPALIRFSDVYGIYKIEIIPVRFQEEEGKTRFASCGYAKVSEVLSCYEGICIGGETELCPFQNGVCLDSERTCVDEDWPACDYTGITGYEQPEVSCEDELDNDCDGDKDGEDTDCGGTCEDGVDTQLCLLQEGVCINSITTCSGGTFPACDYNTYITHSENYEETEVTCDDDWDNDCDGDIDEEDTDCAPVTYCGDGVIQTPNDDEQNEECDDGGTANGDGCSDVCIIEENYVCEGEPSDCSFCNSNNICETSIGEDCACSDCDGKRDGCGDGYMCEEGACTEMDAVASCEQYCAYLEYNDALSFCAANCGGGCPGICEPYDISEHCNPDNPSSPHYCCCVPYS